MEEKASSLQSLSKRKEEKALSGFVSPEDKLEKTEQVEVMKDKAEESVETTEHPVKSKLSKVSDVQEKERVIIKESHPEVLETDLDSKCKDLNNSSLVGWFEQVKKLENQFEALKKREKNYRAGSSSQEEIKAMSLQIKADSIRLENEIQEWFENIYATTKKWDSAFVVSNIKIPEISIKSAHDFISPQK